MRPASRHKTFPPTQGHLVLSTASREVALAGLSLYTPGRPRGTLVRAVGSTLIRLGGPTLLPGRSKAGSPLDVFDGGAQIRELIASEYGEHDGEAAYSRRQPHRLGGAFLLLRKGQPWLFVKVGPPEIVDREFEALRLLASRPIPDFETPVPIGSHNLDSMALLVMRPLRLGYHKPAARPPLTNIVRIIGSSLAELERPEKVPPHWVPAHGDLTPWNVREAANRLYVFDWEDAGYAPPRADELYFVLSSAALGMPWSPLGGEFREAAAYWTSKLRHRGDSRLTKAMLRTLARLNH